MTKADDCPFEDVVPTGKPKSRVTEPQPKSESMLDWIIGTPGELLSFGDFAKLKSGRDSYSGMKMPQLQDVVSIIDRRLIIETFPLNETAQNSCLRWMLRGLDCNKAIRKVKTDLEISENGNC